jgi:eukaryotic-like serine/threonine-protein kinase
MTTPVRLGKYEITEVLGRGAMGVVYKGFDPGIRRTVAIKTIRRELIESDRPTASMLARFRNEARAAGQLAHPGIVAVYDYGEDAEVAYIAMEYVEGNSLREYFDRGTRFTERDIVSIMSQLLDALAHAHSRRVWHRDIKPANLIVMMDGRVKVADFGIARIEASDLTHTGAIMGSPGYMAPEQYAATTIDHRADIFAAGVVFYQLLTGKKPFVGSAEQVAYAICHTAVPRPSPVDPDKGWERYDAIVDKALAKRPEDRFKSAEAFRTAMLEAHAAPASPTIAADTIITEVLRPAAAVDPSSPSRTPLTGATHAATGAATAAPSRSGRRWGAITGIGLALAAVAAGATWYAAARKAAQPTPATEQVAAVPAAPRAAPREQSEREVVFWESVRNSTDPAELQAYLAQYPDGAFAALAHARLDALAASAAKRASEPPPKVASAPPAPERTPAQKPAAADPRSSAKSDQEALFWESVRATSNPAELKAYLERYPQGTFAPLARARLDAIGAAEAKRAAEARPSVAAATAAAPGTPAVAVPATAETASGPGRFDGRWTVELACEAFSDLQAFRRTWSTEIRNGVVELTKGTPGNPGYWYTKGQIGNSDHLLLVGTVIAASAAYRGKESVARFDGPFGPQGYEATGGFGRRHCTLKMARATG